MLDSVSMLLLAMSIIWPPFLSGLLLSSTWPLIEAPSAFILKKIILKNAPLMFINSAFPVFDAKAPKHSTRLNRVLIILISRSNFIC